MRELLRLETDRALLILRDAGGELPAAIPAGTPAGRVVISPRRPGLDSVDAVVEGMATRSEVAALRLYEQREYSVYARANGAARTVAIAHRDPIVRLALGSEDGGHSAFGRVNFGSQIGHTTFTLIADGEPELDVELEVFPTKLDYASDYEQLFADVQRITTDLALAYLRATFHRGKRVPAPEPSELEWLVVLRGVVDDLERALRFLAARPVRGLTREPRLVPASRIRRVDAALRTAVRRGRGAGPLVATRGGAWVRSQLEEHQARPTLDTAEHRWLAAQMQRCRQRVGEILRVECKRARTERRDQTIDELRALDARLAQLCALAPLAAAGGPPPPGFASLQLLGAPGYREAYRLCVALGLGLRIQGGPLELSVKELSTLYEYWCYLAVLQVISEETASPIDPRALIEIKREGLQVALQRGRTTSVAFGDPPARTIEVTYHREFSDPDLLSAQNPDIVVALRNRGWPEMHLVLDAKYRVDASSGDPAHDDVPRPPPDALNVLHRYRDAILVEQPAPAPAQRSVVQAVALYPAAPEPAPFKATRLWRMLERVGIGAIPLLPGSLELLRDWLRTALVRGGWAVADQAPRHVAVEAAHDWRAAAATVVLVGVLRADNPAEHRGWICDRQLYYLPKTDTQQRQFVAARVAIYSPGSLLGGGPGAVTHVAEVKSLDVVERSAIDTPWPPTRSDQLQIIYQLGPVEELPQWIHNRDRTGRGQRVSGHRWTSALALRRARDLQELLLETEPEWRLFETLRARGVELSLDPMRADLVDAIDPHGRVWFEVGKRRARYTGLAGFALDDAGRPEDRHGDLDDACKFLLGK